MGSTSWRTAVQQIKSETLFKKYLKQKGLRDMAHMVEHLLSKCKALSSNPSNGVLEKKNSQRNV
jgi:hypothetical protein